MSAFGCVVSIQLCSFVTVVFVCAELALRCGKTTPLKILYSFRGKANKIVPWKHML